jgi:hypothetical protein
MYNLSTGYVTGGQLCLKHARQKNQNAGMQDAADLLPKAPLLLSFISSHLNNAYMLKFLVLNLSSFREFFKNIY